MKPITKQSIFDFLKGKGYEKKETREGMTHEQFVTLSADFTAEFGKDFQTAMLEAQTLAQSETERGEILLKINTVFKEESETPPVEDEETPAPPTGEAKPADQTTVMAGVEKLISMVNDQKAIIAKLSKEPENPKPKSVNAKIVAINSGASSEKYLFGIEAPMFDRSKPWNQVAATKIPLEILAINGTGLSGNWKGYENDFQAEVKSYGQSLSNRMAQLQAENRLSTISMAQLDFTGFNGLGWGSDYIVRRQDALISYLRTLPTLGDIFATRYGVQNKMEMTNAFLDDFSQAWQSGRVFKGGEAFEPILAQVFNVMLKRQFSDMKNLEAQYIGYLNREDSFPIKWSMVEWLMVSILQKLINEQNERRIRGRRVEPVATVAGHHMLASNGLIAQLDQYCVQGYLQRETDLNTYTAATIYAYVDTFIERLNQLLPTLAGYVLYINRKHVPWYLKGYEAANGTKLDYDGAKLQIKNYTLDSIQGVPNMGNSCLMFVTMPGNIELYENAPGELAAFYFQQDLDLLLVMSTWKEGVGAYMVGKKNGTKLQQFIFLNYPITALVAGATTADATLNNQFQTINNAGGTAFTDFAGASEGVAYKLVCGGLTNATTIAKAGKFANITAAWTPVALNDFLEVVWNATSTQFVEVARRVNGVLS